MKKFSKILSVALLVALVLSLGVANAFAAGTASISITHDDSYEGATGTTARVYNAYKVLDAHYTSLSGSNTQAAKDTFTYAPDDAAVSYTMATDSPWKNAMLADGQTWLDVTLSEDGDVYIVTPKDGFDSAEEAKDFGDYLKANIPGNAVPSEVTVDAATATAVDPGYYLIVGKDAKDAVTRVAVVTTNVTMVEKNTYITTGKTTSETSYDIGDTVTYTATVFIPSDTALTEPEGAGYKAGHGPVILHDKMDSRLTFDGVSSVTAKIGTADFTDFTATTTVSEASDAENKCTFEVAIPVTSTLLGQTITFTYTATVNENAVNDEGFVNELGGELNGYKTNPDDVHVYTFDFMFNKTFTGSDSDALTATFEVRTDKDDANTAIKFVAAGTKDVEVTEDETTTTTTYTVYKKAVTGGDATITVKNGEHVDLVGLKAGTYYLVETGTSTGYNRLTEAMTVVIHDDTSDPENPAHHVTYSGNGINETTGEIPLVNNSGSVLPSTGGIGTTIFYVVGGVLVLAAIILLVTKKRMSE